MKKIFTLFLILFSLTSNAQTILNTTIDPSSPTDNDQIKLYAELAFPSAACNLENISIVKNGNAIFVSLFHCSGMLTVICNITDTVAIGQLTAGTYDLETQLFYGSQNLSGICANYTQVEQTTTMFIVSTQTGIKENAKSTPVISIQSSKLIVANLTTQYDMNVYDVAGKLIATKKVSATDNEMSLNVSGGYYFYELMKDGKKEFAGKIFIK